jgi:hypothetical protein
MRKGLLGLLVSLTAGTGLALAQPPSAPRAVEPGVYATLYPDLAAVAAGTAAQPAPSAGLPPALPAMTSGCDCCATCAPAVNLCQPRARGERTWGDVELLLWVVKNGPVPPLVATVPAAQAPGAVVGPEHFDYGLLTGIRSSGGFWLDDCHQFGLESSGFAFLDSTDSFAVGSGPAGSPGLGRPFTNPVFGPGTVPLSIPGVLAGGLEANSTTQLNSSDLHLLAEVYHGCRLRAYGLIGFRYLELQEDLNVSSVSTLIAPPATAALTAISQGDRFATWNQFYGGQIGGRAEWTSGRLTLNLTTTVSLGVMQQLIEASGATNLTTAGGGSVFTPVGFLVQPSNAGRGFQNEFAVIPEVGLKVAYQLTRRLSVQAGYTWLYVNNVVRPGDQVDLVAAPPTRPVLPFNHSDFFAHGANFGVAYRY